MLSGRQTRRNTAVAESSSNEMDPWKDDRCRDFAALNVARRVLEFHTGSAAPRTLDAKYVTHPESLPQLDALSNCAHFCRELGSCLIVGTFCSIFDDGPLREAHATHKSAKAASSAPSRRRRESSQQQQHKKPETDETNASEGNDVCCHQCTDFISNHFLDLLSRGVVLDRFNVRELAFANWVLSKGVETCGGKLPALALGRKELLTIMLRNNYYELLKRPRPSSSNQLQQQQQVDDSHPTLPTSDPASPMTVKSEAPPPTKDAAVVSVTTENVSVLGPCRAAQVEDKTDERTKRLLKARQVRFDALMKPCVEGAIAELEQTGGVFSPAEFSFAQRCLLVLGASRVLDPNGHCGVVGENVSSSRPPITYHPESKPFNYWSA